MGKQFFIVNEIQFLKI